MKQKIPSIVGIIIIIIIAATTGMYLYQYEKNQEWPEVQKNKITNSDKIFCTQEAKECPDGSYVGRTGPNCEFAPCSSKENELTNKECTAQGGKIYNPQTFETTNCPDGQITLGKVANVNCPCLCCKNNDLVGNDKDEHGCIGSAGYLWCEEKQKCLRSWEESCGKDLGKMYQNDEYKYTVSFPVNWITDDDDKSNTIFYDSQNKCASLTVTAKNINRESVFDVGATTTCKIKPIIFDERQAQQCITNLNSLYSNKIRILDANDLNWEKNNEISLVVTDGCLKNLKDYEDILPSFSFIRNYSFD